MITATAEEVAVAATHVLVEVTQKHKKMNQRKTLAKPVVLQITTDCA